MMVFETDYWFRSMQLISWKHPWQITRESCTILAHTWQHSGLESYSTLSGQFRWLIALNVIIAFNHGRCYRGKSENVHQLSRCIINWLKDPSANIRKSDNIQSETNIKVNLDLDKFNVHQCQAQIEIWRSPDIHLTTCPSSDLPLTLT